jgi:hypothetical protein
VGLENIIWHKYIYRYLDYCDRANKVSMLRNEYDFAGKFSNVKKNSSVSSYYIGFEVDVGPVSVQITHVHDINGNSAVQITPSISPSLDLGVGTIAGVSNAPSYKDYEGFSITSANGVAAVLTGTYQTANMPTSEYRLHGVFIGFSTSVSPIVSMGIAYTITIFSN